MENKSLKNTLAVLAVIGGGGLIITSLFSHGLGLIELLLKLALICIGLVALIKFKEDNQVAKLGGLVILLGGALALIFGPFLGGIISIIGGGLLIASFANSSLKDLDKDDIKTTFDATKTSLKNLDVKDVKEAVNTSKETLSKIKKEDIDGMVNDVKDNVKDINVKEMANKAKEGIEAEVNKAKESITKEVDKK